MEYVLLQCVTEKKKLRVKMLSSQPFIKGCNCQFPRDIRQEGLYFVVKSSGIALRTNFYTMLKKDNIVLMTFDLNEVKKYIDDLGLDKVKMIIYGDDDDDMQCSICMDDEKEKSMIFVNCGHFIACDTCAPLFKKCPMCNAAIVSLLKRTDIAD